jgi:hypothetical protein
MFRCSLQLQVSASHCELSDKFSESVSALLTLRVVFFSRISQGGREENLRTLQFVLSGRGD